MTVQPYEPPAPLPATQPADALERGPVGWVARLRAAAEIAAYIGGTEFVPETLRNRPEAITAAILYGGEVGLEPMQALRSVAMIKGTPALKAEAMRALVVARRHELWLEDSTVTRAIAAGRRAGSDRVGRVTWTMDDAKRAGIAGQPNYQRYPREMLVARATSALARVMFADVVAGLVAAEELEDYVHAENGAASTVEAPPPAGATPAERKTTRRSRPAAIPEPPAPVAEPGAGAAPAQPPAPVDDQPEPPVPPEPLATEAYKRRIFATMRDLGLSDRDERLAYTSRTVGRGVASSNELTIGEASRLIEQLEADVAARRAGERAFLDELRETFDATDLAADTGGPGGAEEPAEEPLEHGAAGEPRGDQGANEPPDALRSDPVPYNEFPDGF